MIVLNDIDGILIRIVIGALSSFFGGLGVVLFVKLFLIKGLGITSLADTARMLNLLMRLRTK